MMLAKDRKKDTRPFDLVQFRRGIKGFFSGKRQLEEIRLEMVKMKAQLVVLDARQLALDACLKVEHALKATIEERKVAEVRAKEARRTVVEARVKEANARAALSQTKRLHANHSSAPPLMLRSDALEATIEEHNVAEARAKEARRTVVEARVKEANAQAALSQTERLHATTLARTSATLRSSISNKKCLGVLEECNEDFERSGELAAAQPRP